MDTTKRLFVSGLVALFIVGLGMFLLMGDRMSAEARAYSNRTLRGDYKFHIVEVQLVAPGIFDFCEEQGTVTFDGRGNATIASTRRCSNPPVVEPVIGALTYTVFSDGQVEFDDVGGPPGTTTHGWIVDNGRTVLVDGTTRDTPGDVLVTHGTGSKQ